jgi:hypothetical protein
MSVSSVSSSSNIALIQWLASRSAQSSSQTGNLSSLLSSSDTNGSVSISHLSKFLSRLDGIAQSDPDKFKSMMSETAAKLSTAADNETGEVAASLNKVAEQFSKAAETGTTNPLRDDSSSSDVYSSCTDSTTAKLSSLLELYASEWTTYASL